MRKFLIAFVLVSLAAITAVAQTTDSATQTGSATAASKPAKKRGPIFRANKAQITEVQELLKGKGIYAGDATGKLDPATRTSIKAYQKDNGLRSTGTLNRATLEKMGIALTESQKEIPVSPNSFASAEGDKKEKKSAASGEKAKRVIFRATKDQINQAQAKLKTDGHYTGDKTGKLDPATRSGLKKFQEANGLKVTGTLNQVTLEKMGIELTDKQKENAAKQ